MQPKYWPTWLGLALLRLSTLLPYRWQLGIGKLLGLLLFKIGGRRRHIAAVNLKLCFPELDEQQHLELLRRHFISLGISFMEIGLAWWGSDQRVRKLIQIEGLENLDAALSKGNGVILLSAHFTTLEIGGRMLALSLPFRFNALYRKHKSPVFERAQANGRNQRIANPIPREDMRQMLKRLKNNEAIWYAPDQNYGHKHSVFADFFNVPAATNTTTARLAKLTGAAVVPFFQSRKEDGSGYQVRLLPALEEFPCDDVAHDTDRINRLIEEQVRKIPEQYLWVHRRFKDRPAGEQDVYQQPKAAA